MTAYLRMKLLVRITLPDVLDEQPELSFWDTESGLKGQQRR
jgi:hypothetical protein